MKWTNKGHQFDKEGEKLKNIRTIYIYGAGKNGQSVLEAVSFLNIEIYFVDQDEAKQGKLINDCLVVSPEIFEQRQRNSSIVVFAVSRYQYVCLMKELLGEGMEENVDFFFYDVFLEFYLGIISVYKFQKVYIEQLTQMVTTYCSLNCKNCMMSIPYLKEKAHIDLEKLKQDADLLFKKVDFIKYYGPGGGEIFLYPQLEEFLKYIIERYSKQIGTILLVTNATVLPNESLVKFIAKNNLEISISSYEAVCGWKEKRDRFVEVCKKNGIRYYEQKQDSWIDMGWNKKMEKQDPRKLFRECNMPCREFADGIEYYCIHGRYAGKAGKISCAGEEGLDFTEEETDKKVILEYNVGFSKKGYLGICGNCNGYFGINSQKIPVAEQL